MKRVFAFNGTVLMGYNKFYSIDLTPIGFYVTHLITHDYRIKFKVLATNADNVYTSLYAGTNCYTDDANIYLELFPYSVEQCPVKEVPLKDFSLWIGSKYMSYEFETLLKG